MSNAGENLYDSHDNLQAMLISLQPGNLISPTGGEMSGPYRNIKKQQNRPLFSSNPSLVFYADLARGDFSAHLMCIPTCPVISIGPMGLSKLRSVLRVSAAWES
jgi:hypothetical protein